MLIGLIEFFEFDFFSFMMFVVLFCQISGRSFYVVILKFRVNLDRSVNQLLKMKRNSITGEPSLPVFFVAIEALFFLNNQN